MSSSALAVGKQRDFIIPDKRYSIEEVKAITLYSTGHLRHLERDGRIPPASRDNKQWRFWLGADVLKILDYKESIYNKEKGKNG